jgi:hypothetical protein
LEAKQFAKAASIAGAGWASILLHEIRICHGRISSMFPKTWLCDGNK